MALDYNPIFGIIVTKTLEIGLLTSPLGLIMFPEVTLFLPDLMVN